MILTAGWSWLLCDAQLQVGKTLQRELILFDIEECTGLRAL